MFAHVVPFWQVSFIPLQRQYLCSQSLVSDRPASQDTWVAFVIIKAERTAAMARMKRILLVEKVFEKICREVGREGWSRRLVE